MTTIEWTDETWNPVRGCSIVSKGCTNCYAMKQAHRFGGAGGKYEGLTKLTKGGPVWTGRVETVPAMLGAPLRWAKPRRVFVNSMSDLFHDDVPDEFIDQVFAVMSRCYHHKFQVLTKRPERMARYMDELYSGRMFEIAQSCCSGEDQMQSSMAGFAGELPNVWLGVSVEDQATADERIPLLLQTPAAVRWVSAEPLLEEVTIFSVDGPVDVYEGASAPLNWVVVGGESGPGARPFNLEWARWIVAQCDLSDVPVFVKQLGARPYEEGCEVGCVFVGRNPASLQRVRDRKGAEMSEWPEDLRVREWPCA